MQNRQLLNVNKNFEIQMTNNHFEAAQRFSDTNRALLMYYWEDVWLRNAHSSTTEARKTARRTRQIQRNLIINQSTEASQMHLAAHSDPAAATTAATVAATAAISLDSVTSPSTGGDSSMGTVTHEAVNVARLQPRIQPRAGYTSGIIPKPKALSHAAGMGSKFGFCRRSLEGVRPDDGLRLVTTPDSTMSMSQIGITFNVLMTLTKPEVVSPLNRSRLLQAVLRGSNQFGGCCEVMVPMDDYIERLRGQSQHTQQQQQRNRLQLDDLRAAYRLRDDPRVDDEWVQFHQDDDAANKDYVAQPGAFAIDDYQLNRERFYIHRVGRQDRRALMLFLDHSTVYVRRYYTDGSALPYLKLDFTLDTERTRRGEFWNTVADGVLNFRYPSLSSDSFHYMRVCIDVASVNIIRTHPLLCTPLGCDFDGDEQNCIGISDKSVDAECRLLAATSSHMVSPTNSDFKIAFYEDALVAIMILTHPCVRLNRTQVEYLLDAAFRFEVVKKPPRPFARMVLRNELPPASPTEAAILRTLPMNFVRRGVAHTYNPLDWIQTVVLVGGCGGGAANVTAAVDVVDQDIDIFGICDSVLAERINASNVTIPVDQHHGHDPHPRTPLWPDSTGSSGSSNTTVLSGVTADWRTALVRFETECESLYQADVAAAESSEPHWPEPRRDYPDDPAGFCYSGRAVLEVIMPRITLVQQPDNMPSLESKKRILGKLGTTFENSQRFLWQQAAAVDAAGEAVDFAQVWSRHFEPGISMPIYRRKPGPRGGNVRAEDVDYYLKNLVIHNGVFEFGMIGKGAIGEGNSVLLRQMCSQLSPDDMVRFMDRLFQASVLFLS